MTENSQADKPSQQASETVTPESNPHIETDLAPREAQAISHIPPPPITPPQAEQSGGDHTPPWKKKLEISAVWIPFALLVVNILALCATNKAANAARTAAEAALAQTVLLSEQLEATQSAMVNAFEPSRSGPYLDDTTFHFNLRFKNTGKGIAHNVNTELQITWKTLPTEASIGTPVPWNVSIGELPPIVDPNDRGIDKTMVITVKPDQLKAIDAMKETIWIQGTISFDNGFRKALISQPVCFVWQSIPPNSGGNGSFQTCDSFEMAYKDAIGWQMRARSKSK